MSLVALVHTNLITFCADKETASLSLSPAVESVEKLLSGVVSAARTSSTSSICKTIQNCSSVVSYTETETRL